MRSVGLLGAMQICMAGFGQWSSVGGGMVGADTWDLFFDHESDLLYAVGGFRFMSADSLQVNGVAAWDGQSWNALGGGVTHPFQGGVPAVKSMVEYDSALVVCGVFDMMDSIPNTKRIAQWRNDQWMPIGIDSTMDGNFAYLTVIGDDLHVLGAIDTIDGQAINNWGLWDGLQWMPADPSEPFDFGLAQAVEYEGELYVGGNFVTFGGLNDLVRGQPGNWSEPGSGVIGDAWINDMVVYDDMLWVTGEFFEPAGNAATALMTWDGANWYNAFPDLHFFWAGRDLHVANGKLYFAAPFTVDGLPGMYDLGVYDGSSVCVFGGPDIYFAKLACSSDTLFGVTCAYLNLTCAAPGLQVNGLAKWPLDAPPDTCFAVEVGLMEPAAPPASLFHDVGSDLLLIDHMDGQGILRIYDPIGRLIMEHRVRTGQRITLPEWQRGIYLASLTDLQGRSLAIIRLVRQ